MSNLTLYQIAAEYRAITDVLMDSGCDDQTLKDTLEGEAWPLELKAQNYAKDYPTVDTLVAKMKSLGYFGSPTPVYLAGVKRFL